MAYSGGKRKRINNKEYTVTNPHSMVCLIEREAFNNEPLEFLLLSDLHLDHPDTDRKLLKQHLDEAKRKNARVVLNGDTYCVMQGQGDRRGNKSSVRVQNMTADYFDSIVKDGADFFEPYAHLIDMIGIGNHENTVLFRNETDLINRTIYELKHRTGKSIVRGQYHGWILVRGRMTGSDKRSGTSCKYVIYYNHGSGGETPVTQGKIEEHRRLTQIESADAIWQGHNHNKNTGQIAVHYLDTHHEALIPRLRIVDMIRTASYKQEYKGNNWHIEKGRGPKPLGGCWLTLIPRKPNNKGMFFESRIVQTHQPEIEL